MIDISFDASWQDLREHQEWYFHIVRSCVKDTMGGVQMGFTFVDGVPAGPLFLALQRWAN